MKFRLSVTEAINDQLKRKNHELETKIATAELQGKIALER